ncbi:MAG: methyltransferase domain-containing protein [Tepidisphaera sp.]|nr:methyltransferase domain-containing protein [Tepidisphaera sp.]
MTSGPGKTVAAAGVDPNYAYWREHGASWVQEYDKRKRVQVYYHIQELMLTEYVQQSAAIARQARGETPLRVLEFGCGVGRHLANLSRLPGVDAHGYDQSPTMVQGILRWTGQEWFDGHVKVGAPVGRLPYEDASFDIVYTSEVIIHVRPEHVPGILAELMRVAKWQVLHFEPAEHTPISTDSHDGCWRHDLPAAYAGLGATCQTLASGFRLQAPYRVMLGGPAPFTWSPVLLDMYRRLDRDIDAGIGELRERLQVQTQLAATLEARLADAGRAAAAAKDAMHEAMKRESAARAAGEEAGLEKATEMFVSRLGKIEAAHAVKVAELERAAEEARAAKGAAEATMAGMREEMADAWRTYTQAIDRANSLAGEVERLMAERRAIVKELESRLAMG